MKKHLFLFLIVGLLFSACTTGLGEEIDLEAPEITITSPVKNSYQKLDITFTGTCTDNKGVTDVIISNNETGYIYGHGIINGENWTCSIKVPKDHEGEITFLCAANDAFGNSSTKSAKRLHLIVDETAPEGLAWYINKAGKQISLEDKEVLENLNLKSSKNKHIPQNQDFTIVGKMYDAMSIIEVELILKDENNETIISKTVTNTSMAPGQSIYNPSFTFTHEELVAKNSKYKSGKHYFHVFYRSKDNSNNELERELDWILWYPESDFPGIEIGTNDNDELITLRVVVGNSISANFFDDDALINIYWTLRKSCNYTEEQLIYGDPEDPEHPEKYRDEVYNDVLDADKGEKKGKETFDEDEKKADYQCNNVITVPTFPTKQGEELKLIVFAEDINHNFNARIIDVAVDDNAKPLLFIESPIENSIPEINENTLQEFSIRGYTLDSKGCNTVKIAFIPNGIGYNSSKEKETRAKKILTDDTVITGNTILETGEMIWRIKLNPGTMNADKYYEQPFNFKFDMLNGFNGTPGSEDKFFELLVTDNDGNMVFRQFKITGDTIKPTIKLVHPEKNLAVVDYSTEDLIINFNGHKDTGLGMRWADYKLVFDGEEYTIDNGGLIPYKDGKQVTKQQLQGGTVIDYVQFKKDKKWVQEYCSGVDTDETKTKQVNFKLSATDVLKNEVTENLDLILSPLPHITSINSDKAETTYKQKDEITIQVNFSANVNVTGKPKLKLYFNESDIDTKYAIYTRGSGTKTLTFTYTVSDDETAESINGLRTVQENPIELNGGTIKTAEIGDGDAHINEVPEKKSLQDFKKLKVDGKSPKISNISFSANVPAIEEKEVINGNEVKKTKYYVTQDKIITATLEINEDILLSSTPTLTIQSETQNIPFSFQSINGKVLKFTYKVEGSVKDGILKYNPALYFTTAQLNNITDMAGNPMILASNATIESCIVIDKTSPANAPKLKNLPSGNYNFSKDFELTDIENGATAQYSLDDGVSWNDYTDSFKLTSGTYNIKTRQYDKANNVSPELDTVTVVINNTFPTPIGITIKKPDGKYKKGEKVSISLDFDGTIYGPTAGDVKLKIVPYGKTTPSKSVLSQAIATSGSSKVQFEMEVEEGDTFEGITISEVTFTNDFIDYYGNKPTDTTTEKLKTLREDETGSGGTRPGITLDGQTPYIEDDGYNPVNNGVYKNGNDSFTIKLTFNENVNQESGNITLQRKGKWGIPAVLTGPEFLEIYNNTKLTTEQKETLMLTAAGNATGTERLDARTGIAVGPYKKITHGLKETTTLIPDTDTKYVLDFNLDLYDGSTILDSYASDGGKSVSVSDIRKVFEETGYHQHVIDVRSKNVTVNNNVVTIVFANVEDGLEWELLIDEGAFIDATGNEFAGLKSGDYTVWSDKVATPVVRVDRYSHGYGAYEPNADGNLTEITGFTKPSDKKNLEIPSGISTNKTGYNTPPTGYARVRIDCQTPGAKIYYKTIEKSKISTSATTGANRYKYADNNQAEPDAISGTSVSFVNNGNNNIFSLSNNTDATISDLTFITGGDEYKSYVIVGDGLLTTARKDYVTAYATKTLSGQSFKQSENGYEGVFKTVICSAYRDGVLTIEGGTAKGGEAKVNGFPVKDATKDIRYSKNMYQIKEAGQYYNNNRLVNGTITNNYWISYEIVSTKWAILQHRSNYSCNYPWSSYGEYTYLYNFSSWE